MLMNVANGHLVKREYVLTAKSAVEEFIEVRLDKRSVSF